MSHISLLALSIVIAVLATQPGCKREALANPAPVAPAPSAATSKDPELGAWGVDLSGMDRTIKPGDDFYGYVNGAWQARTEIPGNKTEAGPAASLQDIALDEVKVLLEEAAADTAATKGSERRKIGDWYTAFDVKPGDKLYLAPEARINPW